MNTDEPYKPLFADDPHMKAFKMGLALKPIRDLERELGCDPIAFALALMGGGVASPKVAE